MDSVPGPWADGLVLRIPKIHQVPKGRTHPSRQVYPNMYADPKAGRHTHISK